MAPRVALARIAAVFARLSSRDTRRRPRAAAPRARTLGLEGLEDRAMLSATVSVTDLHRWLWEGSTTEQATFRFTRTGDVSEALTVNFDVSGSAGLLPTDFSVSSSSGYTFGASSGTVSFAAGESTASLKITPITDALTEGTDTLVVQLAASPNYDVNPGAASAQVQIVDKAQEIVPATTSFAVDANQAFQFQTDYTTSDDNGYSNGVGLRIHFNSAKVRPDTSFGTYWGKVGIQRTIYNGLQSVTTTSLTDNSEPDGLGNFTADTNDLDDDPTTDRFITIAWADSGGSWPESLPKRLFIAHFLAATGAEATGTTHINFTASSVDAAYAFSSSSVTIAFNQAPTTADAGGPYTVAEGGSVQLTGSAANAVLDPATFLYEWDMNNDGTYEQSGVNLTAPTFSAASLDGPAAITVGLRVTDTNSVQAFDTATVNVTNVLPTVSMTGPTDPYRGVPGQFRTFNLAANDVAVDLAGTFTYDIVWGDGTTDHLTDRPASTTASHAYLQAGTNYTPTVVATDSDGGSSPVTNGPTINLASVERQGSNVAMGLTAGDDDVVVGQAGRRAGQFALTINSVSAGTYTVPSNGSLLIYGLDGTDKITVNGTTSTDRIDVTNQGAKLNGCAIVADSFDTWEFSGLAGTDTLAATNAANTWVLGASNAGTINGTTFTGMEKLVGGTSTDAFQFSAASQNKAFASLDGGGGGGVLDYSTYGRTVNVNLATSSGPSVSRYGNITGYVGYGTSSTLRGGNGTNTWIVSGANAGTVNGATYAGFANLIGGSGADTFSMSVGASMTGVVDGGTGRDVLDYSAYTTAVTVDLSASTATNLGGVRNFRIVVGGSGDDSLKAGSAPMALVGNAGADTLQGGAGRDILAGGAGVDTLNGGGGQDMLYGSNSLLDVATLDTVLQQWNRTTSYESRVGRLGALLTPFVGTGVSNDAAIDTLSGEGDRDWFLTFNLDAITDLDTGTPAETETDLDA
jgi:hypothetical protein